MYPLVFLQWLILNKISVMSFSFPKKYLFLCIKFKHLKQFIQLVFVGLFIISFSQCAKKGRPTGGPKDEEAPLFVTSEPAYEATFFKGDEIKIYFNEYITLKELNKQLVISPPPLTPPLITPQGTPSKFITIKILDTLKANTTYIYDFGNSVQDNNEGNKLEKFKYVFSTGSYIDSLKLSGTVKDAYNSKPLKDIKLLLYKIDSSFTDSIIYKQKPNYVTSTLDSIDFNFTNLNKGKYLLVALKDASSDYIYDPTADKIGVVRDTIQLPRDTLISSSIELYKEILPFKFKRAREARKGLIEFGFEGDPKGFQIALMSDVPSNYKSVQYFESDRDTISYYHSKIENDSLNFIVSRKEFVDTITVRLRKKKLDTLLLSPAFRGALEYNDTLFINTNNPISQIDTTKVRFSSDSVQLPYQYYIDKKKNGFGLLFQKEYKKSYDLLFYPKAVQDIFEFENDTLLFEFRTRDIEDYGNIFITVDNPNNKNIIVELADPEDKTVYSKSTATSETLEFKNLLPKKYQIRIIYDDNGNGKWDTGNYLKKQKPEKVEYFKTIPVRAFFDTVETITIND